MAPQSGAARVTELTPLNTIRRELLIEGGSNRNAAPTREPFARSWRIEHVAQNPRSIREIALSSTDKRIAHFKRFLWAEHQLIIVVGSGEALERGWMAYVLEHAVQEDVPEAASQIPRLIVGAALALVSSPARESWGWTLTFKDVPYGFFCGAEPEGMLCASTRVAEPEKVAMSLQRQVTPQSILRQSNYVPRSTDPLSAIEDYFRFAEQIVTRLGCDAEGRAALFQALPDGDFSPVENLSEDALVDLAWSLESDGGLKLLDEMILFYACRCNDEAILNMITSLPDESRKELWGDEKRLKVECPRCSRTYVIERHNQVN